MSSSVKRSALINSLSAPAYTIAETSRLTGIPPWSIGRYLRGYDYNYKYPPHDLSRRVHQPPVVEQSKPGSTYASFLDLIDLLYVKELLNRNFSLQYIRLALDEAKQYLGSDHFARSVFYTSSQQIILQLPKDSLLIALMTGGQYAIPQIAQQLSDKLDFENITEFGFARKWYPQGRTGFIVIDPQISFGKPSLIGHGITTANIYDLYLGENKRIEPVSEWFRIPANKVTTAVQFEHSLWM